MIQAIFTTIKKWFGHWHENLMQSHRAYEQEREKQKLLFSTTEVKRNGDHSEDEVADLIGMPSSPDSLESLFHDES